MDEERSLSGKSQFPVWLWGLAGLFLFCLGVLRCPWLRLGGDLDKLGVGLLFAGVAALALLLLYRAGLEPHALALCLLPLGLAIFLRVLCLEHATGDYNDFLAPWTVYFRTHGGFLAIKDSVGNYNVPYLYFLAAISYLPVPDLYLIKLFSIVFDILLAWAGLRIVQKLYPEQDGYAAATFSVLLLLPTVILNGAYWGQCDSVYAALVLLALADTLDDHPVRGAIWLGFAFSFKLQAIFLIPLWCILWCARKVKFRHLLFFPVSYAVTILPALLLGKPIKDILGVYVDQAGQYRDYLTLNAPSLYALIPRGAKVDTALFARIGIIAAFALTVFVLLWLLILRHRLSDRHLVTAGVILAIGIPLLLPHMHERYFYLAETLAVVWAMGSWRRSVVPILVQGATLAGYYAYLRQRYLYPMSWAALLLLATLVITIIAMGLYLHKPHKREAGG